MTNRIDCGGLAVARELLDLVNNEILPGTGVSAETFWSGFARIVEDLGPKNRALLEKRLNLRAQINQWHQQHPGTIDAPTYQQFLSDIGYLVAEGADFEITTSGVDRELSAVAGPQLVVPVSNARYALNAANARWGSLYDALYGTDLIPEDNGCQKGSQFNPARGFKVIEMAAALLDEIAPLAEGQHSAVEEYAVESTSFPARLVIVLKDGSETVLERREQFAGFSHGGGSEQVLLQSNGLHVELQINRDHPVGAMSPSGLKDVIVESALSTIQDCEDSVAAVDAQDKVNVYRNWLGLMKGDLTDSFEKGGKMMTRRLNPDRVYTAPGGKKLTLPGRSMMLVRNVGHLMTTSAILDRDGREIPEGFLDGVITSLCALHDLSGSTELPNSRTGSIYIVKPKMHGPEEAAFTNKLFDRIEDLLDLDLSLIHI